MFTIVNLKTTTPLTSPVPMIVSQGYECLMLLVLKGTCIIGEILKSFRELQSKVETGSGVASF